MRTPHFIGYKDSGDVTIYAYHNLNRAMAQGRSLEEAGRVVYMWRNVPDNTPTIEVQLLFAETFNVDVAKIKTIEPEAVNGN